MARKIVIVGAGQAGARAAAALRKNGWSDDITMIGDEAVLPYERPPLSKDVLSAGADPLKATVYGPAFYQDNAIDLLLSRPVAEIDLRKRTVSIADGNTVPFDQLIFASGSRARTLPIPGAELAGVLSLRTAEDARQLAFRLQPGTSVVLIGGGFIGLEVACSASKRGCDVTVLEARPQLMDRIVDDFVADAFLAKHMAHGIRIRLNADVTAIEGDTSVQAVRLRDGTVIEADVVVVGIGAVANDHIPMRAGLACRDGILVDGAAHSSHPDVYAIGDVARHRQLGMAQGIRLESWENAELQAQSAAQAIAGKPVADVPKPWFWTDQFDWNLQVIGLREPAATAIQRGSPDDQSWTRFHVKDGRIVTAYLMNANRERRIVKQLMAATDNVDVAHLADASRPLRSLLPPS